MVIGNQTQVCYSKYLQFEFYDTKNKQKIKTDKHTKGKINEEMIKKTSEVCFAKLLLFFLEENMSYDSCVYTHQMSVLLRDCWEFLPTAPTSDRSLRAIISAAGPQPSRAPRRRLPKLLHSIGIKRATAETPRALNRREHFQVGPFPLVR